LSGIQDKEEAHQELVLHQGVSKLAFWWQVFVLKFSYVVHVSEDKEHDFEQHQGAHNSCE